MFCIKPLLLQPICGYGPAQGGSRRINADMAKLADAPDLGSGGAIHVGSTPIIRTKE